MSALWHKLTDLIAAGYVRISEHGYDALADDGLTIEGVLFGVPRAFVLEEYPDYPKGLAALVLQFGCRGQPCACGMGNPSRVLSLPCW